MPSVRPVGVVCALTIVLAACSNADDTVIVDLGEARDLLHGPLFSAYDGVHDNQLLAIAANSFDFDASKLAWSIPEDFLRSEHVEGMPEARLLTPKRAGKEPIFVRGRARDGKKLNGSAFVIVDKADAELWDLGKTRYEEEATIDWNADADSCGLPIPAEPQAASCEGCHSQMSHFASSLDQSKTARYSNDNLIDIIALGRKPAGGTFNSPFLRKAQHPDCVYARFHGQQLSDDELHAIVCYMRSLKPQL